MGCLKLIGDNSFTYVGRNKFGRVLNLLLMFLLNNLNVLHNMFCGVDGHIFVNNLFNFVGNFLNHINHLFNYLFFDLGNSFDSLNWNLDDFLNLDSLLSDNGFLDNPLDHFLDWNIDIDNLFIWSLNLFLDNLFNNNFTLNVLDDLFLDLTNVLNWFLNHNFDLHFLHRNIDHLFLLTFDYTLTCANITRTWIQFSLNIRQIRLYSASR